MIPTAGTNLYKLQILIQRFFSNNKSFLEHFHEMFALVLNPDLVALVFDELYVSDIPTATDPLTVRDLIAESVGWVL